MLTLALALTLSTLHLPPPSSLHLIEGQVEASQPRLLEISTELSTITTVWPMGSVVMMSVGFGGTATFPLAALLVAIAVGGGLPGVFVLIIGLVAGGLALMVGVAGLIWGAVQSGANQRRIRKLEEERELLMREAELRPQLGSPYLVTLATF